MKQFQPLDWSLARAESELTDFKRWFATQGFVGETKIVKEIASRRHMCGLLAATAGITAPDLIKFELSLKGLFRTDLVLGNEAERKFALIEFEPAEEFSIFAKARTGQYRHWSRHLEHGFGQIVDWAWLKSDHPHDAVLLNTFGGMANTSSLLIICGRDAGLCDDMEKRRFNYRKNNVKIDGIDARVLTYDDVMRAMEQNLRIAKSFAILP